MSSLLRPKLIYDGTCSFCLSQAQRLQRIVGVPLELLPSQSDAAHALLPGLDSEGFQRQMYLLHHGRSYGGAEAIAQALMLNRWWRLGAGCYYLPGVRQFADAAYRLIAKRRHCLSGACEVGGSAAH